MPDITNIEMTPSIPKVVEKIRKPEARSAYSDTLATTMRDYLGEVFNQPSSPLAAQELKKRHGLILFEGSILRGTATEKTDDFDLFCMADDQPIEYETRRELGIFTREIGRRHPEGTTFSDYLMERLKSNTSLQARYDVRIAERQRRKDFLDKLYGNLHGPVKTNSHNFIHIDSNFVHLQSILDAIAAGNDAVLSQDDIPTRVITSLLTTTPDMVFETVHGALAYYQKIIVESLTKLQQTDPAKFNSFYKLLEDDFANLHRSTAWRYPDRDFKLLAEYYLRSGKVLPHSIQPERLVDLVTRRLTNEVIQDDFKYLKTHGYKDIPEKLLEYMSMKYGIETGLTKDELERIANGENLLTQEERKLSPEALSELASFGKRIRLLTVMRRQTKIPTLDEFKQAYLI